MTNHEKYFGSMADTADFLAKVLRCGDCSELGVECTNRDECSDDLMAWLMEDDGE